MTSLPDIAHATASRNDLLPAGAPVLALVSGGADSMALLHLLAAGDLAPGSPLSVLHVNHMLRGADADADADFVAEQCAALGIACRVVRFDVASYAEEDALNLEDAGRRVRYRFADEELDALCESAGVSPLRGRIAVAHNRDDRVETFLARVINGAGSGGLASIAYRRDRIVRPLLDCDRATIRDWLRSRCGAWREDATNTDTTRQRAFVRHELVPVFERANPIFRETLARSMDLLADDDALLTTMAVAFGHDFAETDPGVSVAFDREWMCTLDRAMGRRAIRSALLGCFPDASRLEAAHVEAIVDGLSEDAFARDLPSGLRAETEYGRLIVSRAGEASRAVAPSLLPIPGTADLGPAGLIVAEEVDPSNLVGTPDSITVDAGSLDRLVVDGPRPGDRMRPLGMDGTRKLSDLLVDAKVPRRNRGATPVVRDGERIVWLAGVRMSEEYRIGASTARAVRLTWYREGSGHE
ncbi:MAG: tRNA lysidine(34) synthetase TilS [Coriobacteriia bacterium]|nr:tRNA lysidine(34) synthetase TilS [Coriobacteriia bacterium]